MKQQIIFGILGGLGGPEILIISLIFGVVFIMPLIALISVVTSDFKNTTDKITWVLCVIFLPFLGSLLYFLIGMKTRIMKAKEEEKSVIFNTDQTTNTMPEFKPKDVRK